MFQNKPMKKASKKKRLLIILLGVVVFLGAVVFVNFIPTFSLKTAEMTKLSGKWVNVFYETEEAAAKDVFQYADGETAEIAQKLGFTEKQDINVYIYDNQSTMQTKKYGFIAPLLSLDWYIGDNIGTSVILTSPANPGKVHDYDNNKFAVLHEIVHAYVSVINSRVELWLTEGIALYLSNGKPLSREYLDSIPSFEDTCTTNPITFSDCGGYIFAHTYIEYLEKSYGWETVLRLVKTQNYEDCFGKTKREIYDEWVNYLLSNYN